MLLAEKTEWPSPFPSLHFCCLFFYARLNRLQKQKGGEQRRQQHGTHFSSDYCAKPGAAPVENSQRKGTDRRWCVGARCMQCADVHCLMELKQRPSWMAHVWRPSSMEHAQKEVCNSFTVRGPHCAILRAHGTHVAESNAPSVRNEALQRGAIRIRSALSCAPSFMLPHLLHHPPTHFTT